MPSNKSKFRKPTKRRYGHFPPTPDYNLDDLGIQGSSALKTWGETKQVSQTALHDTKPIPQREILETTKLTAQTGSVSFNMNFLTDLAAKEGFGTVSVEDRSGNVFNMSVISADEAIRRSVKLHNKAFAFFGAFAAIGLVACTVFVTLGLIGELSPLRSLIGTVISSGLTFGVFNDFRRWDKSNA